MCGFCHGIYVEPVLLECCGNFICKADIVERARCPHCCVKSEEGAPVRHRSVAVLDKLLAELNDADTKCRHTAHMLAQRTHLRERIQKEKAAKIKSASAYMQQVVKAFMNQLMVELDAMECQLPSACQATTSSSSTIASLSDEEASGIERDLSEWQRVLDHSSLKINEDKWTSISSRAHEHLARLEADNKRLALSKSHIEKLTFVPNQAFDARSMCIGAFVLNTTAAATEEALDDLVPFVGAQPTAAVDVNNNNIAQTTTVATTTASDTSSNGARSREASSRGSSSDNNSNQTCTTTASVETPAESQPRSQQQQQQLQLHDFTRQVVPDPQQQQQQQQEQTSSSNSIRSASQPQVDKYVFILFMGHS